jgi:transposase
LLLFRDGMRFEEVAGTLSVHVNTIRNWADHWLAEGSDGLYDSEGRGAKPIFSPAEEKIILDCVEKEPRSLRKVAVMVEKRTGKKAHVETFRRILEKLGKFWKRQRKIPNGQLDPEDYKQAKADLEELKRMAGERCAPWRAKRGRVVPGGVGASVWPEWRRGRRGPQGPRGPGAAEAICPRIRHAVKPLWEWCEAGIERARCRRSATEAGRTGAHRLSPSAVILGHGCPKMYHEHGDTPWRV